MLLSVMPRSIGKISAHAFRQLFFLFNTAPLKITKAKLTLTVFVETGRTRGSWKRTQRSSRRAHKGTEKERGSWGYCSTGSLREGSQWGSGDWSNAEADTTWSNWYFSTCCWGRWSWRWVNKIVWLCGTTLLIKK